MEFIKPFAFPFANCYSFYTQGIQLPVTCNNPVAFAVRNLALFPFPKDTNLVGLTHPKELLKAKPPAEFFNSSNSYVETTDVKTCPTLTLRKLKGQWEVKACAIFKNGHYECNMCDSSLRSKYAVEGHIARDHNDQKPIHCDCGYSTYNTDCFRRHHCIGSYRCSECTYTAVSKNHLQRHKLKHSEFRAFVCEKCCKRYKHKHGLQRHMCKSA